MSTATVAEKQAAADAAGTSLAHLYQLSSGYRSASAALAARIEAAVPAIKRGDLSETCAKCPYFKDCHGDD
jgi:hypothetical protein